jgi:predicted DNA-binding transcriptional regulator YafY
MQERATNKADRLLQIERLLLDHPEGLTQSEIARRVGVHRSTINRYLPDLTRRFPIYETDDGQLILDRDSYLTEVRFTLHEAMAVHLAARLMTKTTDKQNPHAASALSKLDVDDQTNKRSFTGSGETPSMAVKDAIGKVVDQTGILINILQACVPQ